jgi:hypothetical protein
MVLLVSACTRSAAPSSPRAPSSAEEPPRLAIPLDLRAAIERSVVLGREIYLQEQAAASGTDAVVAKKSTLDLATFIRARQTALDAAGPFAHPMKPVILPNPEGGILVYLLAPATQRNTVVFGKHYRVSLTAAGEVKSVEPLSKGELEISTAGPSDAEPGDGRKALVVSHLLTSYPLETHVAASFTADLPIYVVTNRGLWCVDHDDVWYVSEQIPDEMSRVVSVRAY